MTQIKIRKEIVSLNINLEEVKHNVGITINKCNYPSNKKNIVLLTFLFMAVQLFNQIAINNNIEPISLKQINDLDKLQIYRGGGKKGSKGKKKKKAKKKKTIIRYNYYNNRANSNNENNENNIYANNFEKRRSIKQKKRRTKTRHNNHLFMNILSKITLGGILLMIILSSLGGGADAQVSSVGMPFDDFVDVIHNTAGIGNNSLTYEEQHDLTFNWGSLYNDSTTFVKGYCAAMSAVSAGLVLVDEFKQLLINKGYATIFDIYMKEKHKELTLNEISLEKKKNINKRKKTRPRDLSEADMTKTKNQKKFPRLTRLNIQKLQRKTYHPGVMSGFPIADISNTQIVSTIFEIQSKKITKYENIDMINLVHQKLIQDRKFSVEEGFIQIDDVVSAIITFPGHAMTVTVLPSGALVVRNADMLHKDTTENWLTYKPPINIDLTDESSPETKQVVNEWNKLNKQINTKTRKIKREIAEESIDRQLYEGNDTSILSYFHKKSILPSRWFSNTPKDSLTPYLLQMMTKKGSVINLIGHHTYDQNKKEKNSKVSLKKLKKAAGWTEIRKDIKCGGVAIGDFFNCIRNMNVGETTTYNKGSYNVGSKEVSISQYIHTPEQQIISNNQQQRRNDLRKAMTDLKNQSKKAREAKSLTGKELLIHSYVRQNGHK